MEYRTGGDLRGHLVQFSVPVALRNVFCKP